MPLLFARTTATSHLLGFVACNDEAMLPPSTDDNDHSPAPADIIIQNYLPSKFTQNYNCHALPAHQHFKL